MARPERSPRAGAESCRGNSRGGRSQASINAWPSSARLITGDAGRAREFHVSNRRLAMATRPQGRRGRHARRESGCARSRGDPRDECFASRLVRASWEKANRPVSNSIGRPHWSSSPALKRLVVQSRSEVGWIISEAIRLVCPCVADAFVGSEASERLQPLSEIVSFQEGG
jgi:hypothetical protein